MKMNIRLAAIAVIALAIGPFAAIAHAIDEEPMKPAQEGHARAALQVPLRALHAIQERPPVLQELRLLQLGGIFAAITRGRLNRACEFTGACSVARLSPNVPYPAGIEKMKFLLGYVNDVRGIWESAGVRRYSVPKTVEDESVDTVLRYRSFDDAVTGFKQGLIKLQAIPPQG